MWRWLIILLAPLWAFAEPITITGIGSTFEEAKNNGFQNAIEFYVGTLVLSEREHHNYKTTKNSILTYSSGFIDEYKIISQQSINNQITVVMQVTVSSNKISDRILGKFTSSDRIDGDRVQTQIDTYRNERNSASRIFDQVLNDYPHRAYNIQQLPYKIEIVDRNPMLVMPYKLSWNYNFLKAMDTVLSRVKDADVGYLSRPSSVVTISVKPPENSVFGTMTQHGFNDTMIPERISDKFYTDQVRIMARLIDKNNETFWYICHHPLFLSGQKPSFYSIGDTKRINLYGNNVEEGQIYLSIGPKLHAQLQNLYKIQMQIVKGSDC